MWNYWQVPDIWLAKERASYWDKFGMPAVRPQYYTVESPNSEYTGLAVTTWWIKVRPALTARHPTEHARC
jgi:peptide/nickel transport system substrate-binding protein/microcin C transport system substrate-binding protein